MLSSLKTRFTAGPILILPDPSKQFIVEVDSSDIRVKAVLSQCPKNKNKAHHWVFFCRHLIPAKKSYDIRDQKLLAVRMTLEEVRHCLEGAEQLFIVLTDHKNLEYLRTAKPLNSHQARWALFFNRLNFSLSYHPRSKNCKVNTLSLHFDL